MQEMVRDHMGQSTTKVRFGTIKILSLFCTVMIFACTHSADNESGYSEALIVHQGATTVHFNRVDGTDQVAYEIAENYPAKRVIGWISGRGQA